MKVVQRGVMKFLPGKTAETMELMKEHVAATLRLGMDPSKMRSYRPGFGGGDVMHTFIFEYEWESLVKFAEFYEKMMQDKEMQELMSKWEAITESHSVDILIPIP